MSESTLTPAERNWAAVAHGSAVLTMIVALSTGGAAGLLGLLAPLTIYLAFYNKSEHVAYHALQALAFQAAGFAVAVAGALLGGALITVAWAIVALLSLILVGLILIPVALGFTVVYALLAATYPFVLAAYAIVGSYKAYNGEDFDYLYIGPAVRRQVHRPTPPSNPAHAG